MSRSASAWLTARVTSVGDPAEVLCPADDAAGAALDCPLAGGVPTDITCTRGRTTRVLTVPGCCACIPLQADCADPPLAPAPSTTVSNTATCEPACRPPATASGTQRLTVTSIMPVGSVTAPGAAATALTSMARSSNWPGCTAALMTRGDRAGMTERTALDGTEAAGSFSAA